MAPQPLPLMSRQNSSASWWIPGSSDPGASGRLIYEPYGQMRLKVISAPPQLFFDELPGWVHGLTVDGRMVTLRDPMLSKSSMNIPGGIRVEALVGAAFVGMHASSERELRLHSLQARIASLTEWLDPPGFGLAGRRTVQVQTPSAVQLGRAPGGIGVDAWVEVVGEGHPGPRPLRIEAQQRGWVRFAPARPSRLSWSALDSTLEKTSDSSFPSRPEVICRSLSCAEMRPSRGRASGPTGAANLLGSPYGSSSSRGTPGLLTRPPTSCSSAKPTCVFEPPSPVEPMVPPRSCTRPDPHLLRRGARGTGDVAEQRLLAFVQALEAYDFRRRGKETEAQKGGR